MDNGTLKKRQKRPLIALHVPPTLLEAVDTLAARQFSTRAEIFRRSVLKELEQNGLCPVVA